MDSRAGGLSGNTAIAVLAREERCSNIRSSWPVRRVVRVRKGKIRRMLSDNVLSVKLSWYMNMIGMIEVGVLVLLLRCVSVFQGRRISAQVRPCVILVR